MSRDAADAAAHDPRRTCLGCGQVRPQEELLRLVRGPSGEVVLDPARRLPGRGAYTCPSRPCLEAALEARKLNRAFRRETRPPAPGQALASLAALTRRRLLDMLGLAARAGTLVHGHDHVLRTIASGDAPVVILATDLSPRTSREMDERASGTFVLRLGSIDDLGAASGHPGCGILAVTDPSVAARIRRIHEQSVVLDLDLSGGGIPS